MIKIIREGKKQITLRRGSCHKCGCIIECDEKDIIYEDRPCGGAYVKCPMPGCDASIHKFSKVCEEPTIPPPKMLEFGGQSRE